MNIFEKVSGEKKGNDIKLFAISTCPWCKKAEELLEELDVEYEYVYIDKNSGKKREKAIELLEEYNPKCNYPTLVINEGEKTIIGYKEEKIKEVLSDA